LGTVGEVVVSRGHVVVSISLDEPREHNTTNQRRRSVVQRGRQVVTAVSGTNDGTGSAVITRGGQINSAVNVGGASGSGADGSTIQLVAENVLEDVLRELVEGNGVGLVEVAHLDEVGTVSSASTFSSITTLTVTGVVGIRVVVVRVGASPLDVDDIGELHVQSVRSEIVLHGRIRLDDVTTLATDVQVVNGIAGTDLSGALNDVEHV